jgi:hypothetical protein
MMAWMLMATDADGDGIVGMAMYGWMQVSEQDHVTVRLSLKIVSGVI